MIVSRAEICINCGLFCTTGICQKCQQLWPVEYAAVFSERTDLLKTLIDEYKFGHKRSAARELASLVSVMLPFAQGATIVPIPTISRHIRERGYDHLSLLARHVARQTRMNYKPLLSRRGQTVQHGASKQDRLRQASSAFTITHSLDPERLYIVIDDITTTGASLRAAAIVLRNAGAKRVWAIALARQPLD